MNEIWVLHDLSYQVYSIIIVILQQAGNNEYYLFVYDINNETICFNIGQQGIYFVDGGCTWFVMAYGYSKMKYPTLKDLLTGNP